MATGALFTEEEKRLFTFLPSVPHAIIIECYDDHDEEEKEATTEFPQVGSFIGCSSATD